MKMIMLICTLGFAHHQGFINVELNVPNKYVPEMAQESKRIMADAGVLSMMSKDELQTALKSRKDFMVALGD